MDTAATKIARLERSIGRTGETVTLERVPADPVVVGVDVALSLAIPAWVRDSEPQVEGEAKDIRVVLSPTLLAAEAGSPPAAFGLPQKFDRAVIQGTAANVETVMPIYWGGRLVRVNLVCRGGAALLDKHVTIRRASLATNDFGEQIPTWGDLATVWAAKKDVGDAEGFAADEVSAAVKTLFCVRWSSLVSDVTPADRLIYDGREFNILAAHERGGREELEIVASARADQ